MAPIPGAADLALGMRASAASVVATSNLTYTVTVTNFGPAGATGVVVTDTLPGGAVMTAASPTRGSVTNVAGVVTWNVGSLARDAGASLTLTIQPAAAGTIINSATVTSSFGGPESGRRHRVGGDDGGRPHGRFGPVADGCARPGADGIRSDLYPDSDQSRSGHRHGRYGGEHLAAGRELRLRVGQATTTRSLAGS